MPTVERSRLHVECPDDVHVVTHLLLRRRIDGPPSTGTVASSRSN